MGFKVWGKAVLLYDIKYISNTPCHFLKLLLVLKKEVDKKCLNVTAEV